MHLWSIARILDNLFQDKPFIGAEVGVFKGQTSKVLLEKFPECRLILVDPWRAWPEGHPYAEKGSMDPKTQVQWNEIYQEALEAIGPAQRRCQVLRTTSDLAAQQIEDKSLDFVFLDADHTYEGTKADIQSWLPKTRRVLLGHDYGGKNDRLGFWGVKRAVDEAFGDKVVIRRGLIWAHFID